MIDVLLVVKALPILFYAILAPFLGAAGAYGLFLWFHATIFLHYLEPKGYWLAYPFQITNGLLYLCRLAGNGFLRFGRRPGNLHFSFYQPGQLYAWRSGIYDEEETRHNWMPQYYRHWVMAANSVLFDSWLGEQNMSRFFRWGSFVRYLYLWIYYVRLSVHRWLAKKIGSSELFFLWASTFWRLWPVFWRPFSLPFWALSQGVFRLIHAVTAEPVVGIFFRFFRLEPWVRLQWYQQQNVDFYDAPLKMYRRPLPTAAYGFLSYGNQRQQQRRRLAPLFSGFLWVSSLISFLLLTLLLLPWALLSVLLATTFSFYRWLSLYQYVLMRRGLQPLLAAGQTAVLRFFSLLFFVLASVSLNFWGLLLELALGLVRWLGRTFLLLAFLLLLVSQQLPLDFYGFLSFGLGTLFYDFFSQFLALPWAFDGDRYQDLSFNTFYDPTNFWELRTERQEAAFYYLGNAYHGHLMYGFPTCVIEVANPPWLPPKRKPEIWVSWWHRPENHWYWERLLPNAVVEDHRPAADYLYWYQQSLYSAAQTAADAINRDRDEVLTFVSFFNDSWLELAYRSPVEAARSAFDYTYYYLAYSLFYGRGGFYWLRLVWWNPFYGLCLGLSLVSDWAIEWPIYRLRLIIRRLALVTAPMAYLLRAIFNGLGHTAGLLLALPQGLAGFCRTAVASFNGEFFSVDLPQLPRPQWRLLAGLSLCWNLTGGWLLWYGSIIFDEFLRPTFYEEVFRLARTPLASLLYLLQLPLLLDWPLTSLESYRASFWTAALSFYVWLQQLWDRLYLPLQLPRNFDDYTLSYRYRYPRRSSTPPYETATVHKGMVASNRHWKLPPTFLFHYTADVAHQINQYRPGFFEWLTEFVPFGWLNPRWTDLPREAELFRCAQDQQLLDFGYLPYRLTDGLNLLLALFPWLYLAGFFLSMAFFPGVSSLLFDRQQAAPTAMFNRQWAWTGCRQGEGQSLEDYEALYCRLPSIALADTKVPWDYVWTPRSLSFFRRSHSRFLQNEGWPLHVFRELQGPRSLGGGRAWPMPYFHDQRRLWIPFAHYLFFAKYRSLRLNFLDEGIAFLRFISLNYRRSPWVPRAFNQYDQYDYQTWLSDSNLDFASRAVAAGAATRQHLERTDRWLFQKQLGHWVWYKDIGIHEFEQTSAVKDWQEQAFELEDKDQEAYYPWGTLWWFFLFPLFFFGQLYLEVESAYNQDPLFPGGGTLELRNFLLWIHSVAGHWALWYEQMEWRGWWLLPEYQRPDTSTTDTQELPVIGYYERWPKGATSNFYPVSTHWIHYDPASSVAPLGTSQPFGLLEEYYYGRLAIQFLPFLLLPLVIRYRGPRPLTFSLAFYRRWPLFTEKYQQYRHLLLWFWK